MIDAAWTTLIKILDTMPWWLAAFLVGWIGSIAVTHPVKVGLRRYTLVTEDNRHLAAWFTAVLSATSIAWAYGSVQAPSPPLLAPSGAAIAFVAVLTGIWSPLIFAGIQKFLRASPDIGKRKGFTWVPDLSGVADWLSGDSGPSKADRAKGACP